MNLHNIKELLIPADRREVIEDFGSFLAASAPGVWDLHVEFFWAVIDIILGYHVELITEMYNLRDVWQENYTQDSTEENAGLTSQEVHEVLQDIIQDFDENNHPF